MNFSMTAATNELRAGICELTLVDEFSVETDKVMGTLAECHMADLEGVERARKIAKGEIENVVEVWNVREERWQKIALMSIGEIERLTGRGVGKSRSVMEMTLEEIALGEVAEMEIGPGKEFLKFLEDGND